MLETSLAVSFGQRQYSICDLAITHGLGSRWQLVSTIDATQYLADIVCTNNNEYMNLLVKNASHLVSKLASKHLVHIDEFGWLDNDMYFQIIDLGYLDNSIVLWNLPYAINNGYIWKIAVALAESMIELHGQGIVHGAITPFTFYESGKILRLGDYWWAHYIDGYPLEHGLKRYTPYKYPNSFMPFLAPEIFQGLEPNIYSDVFSLGAVLYYLSIVGLSTCRPDNEFVLSTEASIVKQYGSLARLRPDLDPEGIAFIEAMLDEKAILRPSLTSIHSLMSYLTSKYRESIIEND
jgi:serine/threonine protein kinase